MKWLQLALFVLFIIASARILWYWKKTMRLSQELEKNRGVSDNVQLSHLARTATIKVKAAFVYSAVFSVIAMCYLSWQTFQSFFP
jgi:hypothetical protein